MSNNSPLLDRTFIESLPDDTDEKIIKISTILLDNLPQNTPTREAKLLLIDGLALLKAFFNSVDQDITVPPASTSIEIAKAKEWITALRHQSLRRIEQKKATDQFSNSYDFYSSIFAKADHYEFSENDFNRIQELINEIRTLVQESTLITETHKRRLLRRLEAMQGELHQKTSDIDRFWGFIGEAGIVVRKFGEDLKPLSDRVQELGKIVVTVITAAEGIKAIPIITHLLE